MTGSSQSAGGPLELALVPKEHSIGAFSVLRSVPTVKKRSVGPFVFVDHMGPMVVGRQKLDVPPHPHIGISTLTYLLEGLLLHRDTTGAEQTISPGAVNWMVAGRGVVHSETVKTPVNERLHGLQFWVALPEEKEESRPQFFHHPAEALPVVREEGSSLRVVVGEAFGERSPLAVSSPMHLLDLTLERGSSLDLQPELGAERALYLVQGEVQIDGQSFSAPRLLVFQEGEVAHLLASTDARALLFGGAALKKRRFMDWNFVSTRPERIAVAKADYRAGRLGALPEDGENLPLPEDG